MSEVESAQEDEERVVLARKEDTFAGLSWTGEEPEGLIETEEAEAMGAVWEGDELVTYDIEAMNRTFRMASESEETGYRPDND
jgi:hypothetical protein